MLARVGRLARICPRGAALAQSIRTAALSCALPISNMTGRYYSVTAANLGCKTLDRLQLHTGNKHQVSWTRDTLSVTNSPADEYSVVQIRDNCSCAACRDVSSGQKTFATSQLPLDMNITKVRLTDDNGLAVTVDKDMESHGGSAGHEILLASQWVDDLAGPPVTLSTRYGIEYWDGSEIKGKVQRIDYEAFMQDDGPAFWDAIRDIMRLGIVFLRNVPRDEESVSRIALRIANIQETFYGRTFDVRAKPNAENVAYTSGYLGLHQDLLYLRSSPFVQILHCMDNSCKGGESLFSDAERVGAMLELLFGNPEYSVPLQPLFKYKVPYGYARHGHRYRNSRALLRRHTLNTTEVCWSPPFQAEWNQEISHSEMAEWVRGARIFEDAVNSPTSLYQTRMEPGDCVLFNNRRVLHGRTAFDTDGGGSRWLRGTYISREDFCSRAFYAPESHASSPRDAGERAVRDKKAREAALKATSTYEEIEREVQRVTSSRK
jgi:alpha-ketoglutarate-dependent taurine dioxygenase